MLNHSRSSQSHTRNTIIARALVTAALLVSWPAIAAAQDSSIVAWGNNTDGQLDVPAPNMDFVAVAGGGRHSLGLKTDGSIVAWGWNDWGQLNVPAPNTDFVAVAGGWYHSLGLKADGSIVAWGYNNHGQINVPAPNTDFVAVAGGGYHSLGLKADGSVVAWGKNDEGQLNVPAPNTDFVAVAGGPSAGNFHSLGLKTPSPPPPPTGACCIGNGCLSGTEADCLAAGGTYMGDDTTCEKADCPAPCPADFDGSGDVGVKDLLFLLGAWGPCPP